MCGGRSTPKVVERDPKAEEAKAAAEAAKKANEEQAALRARKQQQTLLSRGAQGVGGQANTLMQQAGRATFGG